MTTSAMRRSDRKARRRLSLLRGALPQYAAGMLIVLAATAEFASGPCLALEWGVNGGSPKRMDLAPVFQIMKERGLTRDRIGVNLTKDTEGIEAPMLRHVLAEAKSYNITLYPLFGFPFRWGDRTDAGNYPAGDRDALYKQGFNRTYSFVDQFKHDITTWELENEINLTARGPDDKKLYGSGATAQEFESPIMEDWAAVLHGASDAIDKINKDNGLQMHKELNTTSTMLGFLDFMASRGVNFDKISYHYYEVLGQNPHRNWNGRNPPFDLFKKLASYGRHIDFNEVNCAEIYKPNYGNKPGDPLTEQCLKSINNTLTYIRDQKDAAIDSVSIYEMLDEPDKAPPENRFGLMYDIKRAKIELYLLSRFAGGALSPDEEGALASSGL